MKIVDRLYKKIINIFCFLLKKASLKPFLSLGILISLFFILLLTGAYIRKPVPEKQEKEKSPLPVKTYIIGSAPRMKVLARVEKENVVKITAQTQGVVSQIWVAEGQEVDKGTLLFSLSTNYFGGNAFTIQKQIAKANLDNIDATLPLQMDLLAKQKELAEKNDSNNDELRNINDQSLNETRDLLSLNQDILNILDLNLINYESTNSAGVNNTLILSTKQLKSQYQTAINSLNSSIRSLEYQADSGENPARLSDLTREITLKQLEIQEKTLNLSQEVARLQYRLALINEGLSYPASPFYGRVEKVHVRLGQSVNSGTVLATLTGAQKNISAYSLVTQRVAGQISRLEPAEIFIKDKKYEIFPEYISSEAVEGTLYMVRFDLNDLTDTSLTDGEYLEAYIGLGYADTSQSVPFIPLDSVYQTGEGSYVYLVGKDKKAYARKIILGEVYGQLVEVKSGLSDKDMVILDRKVIAGDKIEIN